jgi:DNA-binding MarR family transcriptional regulator
MKIEEAIKTKKFESPIQKALINVIYTGSWLMARHAESLKPFGISPQQYNVLRILRGSHPDRLTVQSIKERMLDKTPNTTRLVDKLLQKGLVDRERCTTDRRVVYVCITDEGLKFMKELEPTTNSIQEFATSLEPEQASQLSDWLDQVRG